MGKYIVYAVSSMRSYNDGNEVYYGTDGIFGSYEAARAYIRKDMEEIASEQGLEFPADYFMDHRDVMTSFGDRFSWQIEPLFIDLNGLLKDRSDDRGVVV